ncbi:MAG: PASTA domain-containing protein [Anaerolineales bacterium]|nr:PASTA domain-containing protein [Anaerolineales bacterium]
MRYSFDDRTLLDNMHGWGQEIEVFGPATPAAPLVIVPAVTGTTQSLAGSIIVSASLSVGAVTTQLSPTAPAGSVISQNPPAGSLVALGSAVALVVLLRRPPCPVPVWSARCSIRRAPTSPQACLAVSELCHDAAQLYGHRRAASSARIRQRCDGRRRCGRESGRLLGATHCARFPIWSASYSIRRADLAAGRPRGKRACHDAAPLCRRRRAASSARIRQRCDGRRRCGRESGRLLGPPTVPVPDVVGKLLDQAR